MDGAHRFIDMAKKIEPNNSDIAAVAGTWVWVRGVKSSLPGQWGNHMWTHARRPPSLPVRATGKIEQDANVRDRAQAAFEPLNKENDVYAMLALGTMYVS
jgi:hypothetical protein